jgi:hypothetical protein
VVLVLFPFVIGKVAGAGLNLGLAGVITLIVAEAFLFRIYLRWKAAKFGRQPAFHDGWAFCGIAVIVCVWLANWWLGLTLLSRSTVFCGLALVVIVLEVRRFARLLTLIQTIT